MRRAPLPLTRHGLVALVLLIACASDDGTAYPGNGARLKQVVLRADGLPDDVVAWHDSELDVECAFYLAADGARRCVPSQPVAAPFYFTDPDCSIELAYVRPGACEPSPRYKLAPVVSGLPLGCDLRLNVVELQPYQGFDASRAQAYALSYDAAGNRTCAPAGDRATDSLRAELAGATVLRGGAVMAPERFVRVTGQERSVGVPSRVFDVTDDGARITRDLLDATETACTPSTIDDYDFCLPPVLTTRWVFGDASCTKPLASFTTGDACESRPVPEVVLDATDACGEAGGQAKLYARGPETELAFQQLDTCQPSAIGNLRNFERGAPLSPAMFPPLRSRTLGTGRLRARTYFDDQGAVIGSQPLRDQQTGAACSPKRTDDGRWRCLPRAASVAPMFADAACTQPVAIAPCGSGQPGDLVSVEASLCSAGVRVMRLGAALGKGPVFSRSSFGCSSPSLFGAASTVERFALGDDVPVQTFPELARIVTR